MYVAQTTYAGNVDIIKRTCLFKTWIILHYRNSILIASVPALNLYSSTLTLSIEYVHHNHINFKACFPLPRVGLS